LAATLELFIFRPTETVDEKTDRESADAALAVTVKFPAVNFAFLGRIVAPIAVIVELIAPLLKTMDSGIDTDRSYCNPIWSSPAAVVHLTLIKPEAVYPAGMFAPPYTSGAAAALALVARSAEEPFEGLYIA